MKPRRHVLALLAAAAAGCVWVLPAQAGMASASFPVRVQLTGASGGGGSGVCGTAGTTIGCGEGGQPPVVDPPVVVVPPVVYPPPVVVPPPVVYPPPVVVTPPVVDPPVAGGGSQPPVLPPVVVPPVVIPPTVIPPIIVTPGGGILHTPVGTAPFRFVAAVSRSGDLLGTVDIYSGSGTITAWRVVNFGDREYLEMTLGW